MPRVKEGRGTLLGNAGEHYVVAELLRRDVIAAQAPRNAPGIDILATMGGQSVNVRIKTRSEEADSWPWMVKKDGTIFPNLQRERDFVVLVGLAREEPPEYWVVSTSDLDRELRRIHAAWLKAPGRGGRVHKESAMRRIGHWPQEREWLAPQKGRWDVILAALGR